MPTFCWTSGRHRDKLRRLDPDTPETTTLQFMVEERRKLVHEKTRYSNRLTAHLKLYFPQVVGWFDEIGSHIVADFLTLAHSGKTSKGQASYDRTLLHRAQQQQCGANRRASRSDSEDRTGNRGYSGIAFLQRRGGHLGRSAPATTKGNQSL